MWPWASVSNDLEHTVRLAPKPTGRAAPCRQAWQAAKRNLTPMPPAERYKQKGKPSGPGADSRLEARISLNSSNPMFHLKSGGAC